jgi:hypothetical protein
MASCWSASAPAAPCGCGKDRYPRASDGALRRRGTTDTASMEPLRLRRTAAEGLRLNAHTQAATALRPECPARLSISS